MILEGFGGGVVIGGQPLPVEEWESGRVGEWEYSDARHDTALTSLTINTSTIIISR